MRTESGSQRHSHGKRSRNLPTAPSLPEPRRKPVLKMDLTAGRRGKQKVPLLQGGLLAAVMYISTAQILGPKDSASKNSPTNATLDQMTVKEYFFQFSWQWQKTENTLRVHQQETHLSREFYTRER